MLLSSVLKSYEVKKSFALGFILEVLYIKVNNLKHCSKYFFYCRLTVKEHLWFYTSLKGMKKEDIDSEMET